MDARLDLCRTRFRIVEAAAAVAIIEFLILWLGFWDYSKKQEPKLSELRLATSGAQALAHFAAIALIALASRWAFLNFVPFVNVHWFVWLVALGRVFTLIGPPVAGTIYGLSLYLTCRYGHRNFNDAFNAMGLDSHRHFLRLHIKDDTLILYPAGLDRLPARNQWRRNTSRSEGAPSTLRLIEVPIVISGRRRPPPPILSLTPKQRPQVGRCIGF